MQTAFRYARWRAGLYLLGSLGLIGAFGWLAARTEPSEVATFWGAIVVMLMAAAAVLVMLRQILDRRPAVAFDEQGLRVQRLGPDAIAWDEVRGVWLRWIRRRAFYVIPMNTPELVLDIDKDAAFWRRGGLGRTIMRWLSKAGDEWTVTANLNALAGGKPERIIDAVRAVRPALVGETEIIKGAKSG